MACSLAESSGEVLPDDSYTVLQTLLHGALQEAGVNSKDIQRWVRDAKRIGVLSTVGELYQIQNMNVVSWRVGAPMGKPVEIEAKDLFKPGWEDQLKASMIDSEGDE